MTDHIWVLRKDGEIIGCGMTEWGALIPLSSDSVIEAFSDQAHRHPDATSYTHGPYTLALEPHPTPENPT